MTYINYANLYLLFRHSKEIVFTEFGRPFYLYQYEDMRFWYGEDLKNNGDYNNQGKVCFDVSVRYV